jgi:hypothetical protein
MQRTGVQSLRFRGLPKIIPSETKILLKLGGGYVPSSENSLSRSKKSDALI